MLVNFSRFGLFCRGGVLFNKLVYICINNYIYSMEAKALRRILSEHGIKQTWLANKLGVTRAQVNQWVSTTSPVPIPEKYVIQIKSLLRVAA